MATQIDQKYKSKYKKLKKQIKQLVFENASLCDDVSQIQVDLQLAREERRYLIKRLMRHEGYDEAFDKSNIEETAPPKTHVPKKRGPKKRTNNVTSQADCDVLGRPKMPINLCNVLIHSLGEILPANPNFHNSNWIYPVGYVATRIYAHPKDPQRKCVFTCKILNNTGMPQFQIIPDNDLDNLFFGETANVCHQSLLETLRKSLSDPNKLPLRVQGEKFFGLANPLVQSFLKMDPSFKHCVNFKEFPNKSAMPGYNVPEEKDDPTMSWEAFSLITMSAYHTMPEIKDEPPDELFDLN
ncbi:transforming growth factor beta regulator 1 [Haematobia irritans]|uniref:transforming growth factor beta regulator 1 n=1 Tax=Haematobia irritans TaxID=7368 RepID=UPI003F4F58D2